MLMFLFKCAVSNIRVKLFYFYNNTLNSNELYYVKQQLHLHQQTYNLKLMKL
jgi:hypothetical protein